MPLLRFLLMLGSLSGAAALMLYLLHRLPVLQPHQRFSWIALGFFVVLTGLIYLWARISARHANPKLLLQIAMAAVLLKIVACVALVWGYVQAESPLQNRWFLLPFFSLYLLYTIFETYILMRFSRLTPKDRS